MVADNGSGSKLVAALIAAKKKFKPLIKNKVNPHFKSRYADLAAVGDAVDDALASEGLTIIQTMGFDERDHYCIITKLKHVSGEEVNSVYPLPGGGKPQELQSSITYGRRGSKCAILDLAAEDDDDAEAAEGRVNPPQDLKKAAAQKPAEKAPDKRDVSWNGKISAVESIGKGLWKVTATNGDTFATSLPEVGQAANSFIESGDAVAITYRLNSVGTKIIETMKGVQA